MNQIDGWLTFGLTLNRMDI